MQVHYVCKKENIVFISQGAHECEKINWPTRGENTV